MGRAFFLYRAFAHLCRLWTNFVLTEFSEVYFPGGAAMAVRAYRDSRARDWGAPRAA